MKHLDTEKILNDKHGGFRKGFSTMKTISNLTNDILRGINESEQTTAIFIHFSKAFDTVTHDILIQKTRMIRNKRKNIGLDKDLSQ